MFKNRRLDQIVITTNTQQQRRDNHAKDHPNSVTDTFHKTTTDEHDLLSLCHTGLKFRVGEMLNEITSELESLGPPPLSTDPTAQGGLILELLSKFTENYIGALEGKRGIEKAELYGG